MTNADGERRSGKPPQAAAGLEATPGGPAPATPWNEKPPDHLASATPRNERPPDRLASATRRKQKPPAAREPGVRDLSDRPQLPPLLWLPFLVLAALSAWLVADYVRNRGLNESEARTVAAGVQLLWVDVPVPAPYTNSVPRIVTIQVQPGRVLGPNELSRFWQIEWAPLPDNHGSPLNIREFPEACQPLLKLPGTPATPALPEPVFTSQGRLSGKTETPSIVIESTVAVFTHPEKALQAWTNRSELPVGDIVNCGVGRGESATAVVDRTAHIVHARFTTTIGSRGDPPERRRVEVHSVYLVGGEVTAHLVVAHTAAVSGDALTRYLTERLKERLARVESR
jgi:hypothetical protein